MPHLDPYCLQKSSMVFNPFSVGTAIMLMQTGWIQASRRVTRRLAWDPTCLPLTLKFPIKNKQNLKVLKSRRQYNLFLENYPACKGLKFAASRQRVQMKQMNSFSDKNFLWERKRWIFRDYWTWSICRVGIKFFVVNHFCLFCNYVCTHIVSKLHILQKYVTLL